MQDRFRRRPPEHALISIMSRLQLKSNQCFGIHLSKSRPRKHLRRNAHNVITDPLFYLVAIPAVTFLGLGKGGFAGIGTVSTPLMALYLPPLQAAAILLSILII